MYIARNITAPRTSTVPTSYLGDWQAQDGSVLSIRANGRGGFRMGSKNVTGGGVTVDSAARELTIGIFGVGHTWKIDQPPGLGANGTEMKLDGMVYRRTGGPDPSLRDGGTLGVGKGDFTTRANSAGKFPTQAEMRVLVRQSLLDFNSALQKKDFTAFRGTVSSQFAEQFTAVQLRDSFKLFIDRKIDIGVIRNLSATFQPQPSIGEDGALQISGFYPTRPVRVYFTNRYVWQDEQWKLLGLNVRLGEPERALPAGT
jgi:hypothetical protein